MSAPVTKRHRELAFESLRGTDKPGWRVERKWVATGEGDDDPRLLGVIVRTAQALADIEASALAATPLATTRGGELEHLEEGARLLSQYFSDPGAVSSGQLYAWLEDERARKAAR